MSVVHERYLEAIASQRIRSSKRNKKKPVDEPALTNVHAPTDQQRIDAITTIMTRLKTELNLLDVAVGTYQ